MPPCSLRSSFLLSRIRMNSSSWNLIPILWYLYLTNMNYLGTATSSTLKFDF